MPSFVLHYTQIHSISLSSGPHYSNFSAFIDGPASRVQRQPWHLWTSFIQEPFKVFLWGMYCITVWRWLPFVCPLWIKNTKRHYCPLNVLATKGYRVSQSKAQMCQNICYVMKINYIWRPQGSRWRQNPPHLLIPPAKDTQATEGLCGNYRILPLADPSL